MDGFSLIFSGNRKLWRGGGGAAEFAGTAVSRCNIGMARSRKLAGFVSASHLPLPRAFALPASVAQAHSLIASAAASISAAVVLQEHTDTRSTARPRYSAGPAHRRPSRCSASATRAVYASSASICAASICAPSICASKLPAPSPAAA